MQLRLATYLLCFASCSANVAHSEQLQVIEDAATIVIRQAGIDVLTYNKVSPPAPDGIEAVYERSGCLHPVGSPQGNVVTAMFPFDHAHQHGIFSAWVNTTYDGEPVDFWNLAGGTGRVLHERVVSTFETGDGAGFEVDLLHRVTSSPPIDVLRERWKVMVHPTDGSFHCFDLETIQTAITDKPLAINKYHYGGMALRGPTRWLSGKITESETSAGLTRERGQFLNNLGSEREAANHQRSKWVAMSGLVDSKPVCIAVLSHPDNFRAPQPARIHPTKPYFCFSPCVIDAFTIDAEHPLRSRYRYLVTDADPDPKWIDEQWNAMLR